MVKLVKESEKLELALPVESKIKQDLALVNPSEIKLEKGKDDELTEVADAFVEELLNFDGNDFNAKEKSKAAIEQLGEKVQKNASHKSGMLQAPIAKLSQKGADGGDVANALVDLKIKVEELDPGKLDLVKSGGFTRLLGIIPGFGKPLKKYFSKYEKAQTTIDAIVNSLKNGKTQLRNDNIQLIEDQKLLREATFKLEKAIKLAEAIDIKLAYKLEREIATDDPKYKFVEDELLFPLRQRTMDLQQQLAVAQQGVLAMEIIIRNNKELMRGVDRAINVTVNALQVAVAVALALANQKIVLDKIKAINETTSNLIANTAARLKQQGVEIHKEASGSMLNIESLKSAFADINDAMENISAYRSSALPIMAQNILEFDKLTKQGEESIKKMENGNQVAPSVSIEI